MKTIFAVDDSDTNLAMAEEALETHYRILPMPSAAKMFSFLEKMKPDLILLDIEMPEINGLEALKRLKAHRLYADIPVIFLTGRIDTAIETQGFELGAVDFITKPFSASVLLRRIKAHLDMDELIRERTAHLRRLQNGLVHVLADMVENRDKGTGGHIERTTSYIKILIKAMEERSLYVDELRTWDMETTNSSARLHDVGKIVIPDIILNKPGGLTDEEFEIMKSHVTEGERIIDKVIERTGEEDFLWNAKLFAGYHHERWDGTGYPRGLKGTEIPLQGRIMAVADVYDALVSKRPYKEALPDDKVVSIITSESGKYFDPKIVDVFLEVKDLFKEVTMGLGQTRQG
ncbi:MAG: response regulator [Treponema sp.]|jgi:putative two-component system response regulator|nr:response regulator [Treponema sp.]